MDTASPYEPYEPVLGWWFGDWDDRSPAGSLSGDRNVRRWWGRDPEIDADARARFAELHAEVVGGGHASWEATARGLLARVIVLDPLSRMLFRDTGVAYQWDAEARTLTQRALERAYDRDLKLIERVFLYYPLMHAEDRATHRRALALYSDLAEEAEEAGLPRAEVYRQVVAWEIRSKQVIDRFGRYPSRNFALERTCTPDELAYIQDEDEVWIRLAGNP